MKVLDCTATHRRLQAYHDGELPVGRQIEVDAHLEWCDECADALADLQALGRALRMTALGRTPLTGEESEGFRNALVSRAGAENTLTLAVRLRGMFDDMHFIYPGMGAAAAIIFCLTIMLSMTRFAALVTPGSNQNPVVVDVSMLMPHVLDDGFEPATSARSDDEGAFTLSAVVTREGRLVNLELHPGTGQAPAAGSSEARDVESMLDAVAQARFEPARVAGFPVAVNMVWLVEHTTVRAAKIPEEVLPVAPTARKRQADLTIAPSALVDRSWRSA